MATRTFSADIIYTGQVINQGGTTIVALSTGATTAANVNYGISVYSYTSGETITLQPPLPGIERVITCVTSSTSLTPLVRASTGQTVTLASPMGGNTALPTMFRFAATRSTNLNTVVTLVGISTSAWAIKSVYPIMTTGNGGGSITLSTT